MRLGLGFWGGRRAGGARAYDPELWLDGALGKSGDPIAVWSARVGSYHVSQGTTAYQPTDGGTTVEFDGGNDSLQHADVSALGSSISQLWLALAFRCDDTSQNQGILNIGNFAGDQGTLGVLVSSNKLYVRANEAASSFNDGFTKTTPVVFIVTLDGGTLSGYLDGEFFDSVGGVANLNCAGKKLVVGSYVS